METVDHENEPPRPPKLDRATLEYVRTEFDSPVVPTVVTTFPPPRLDRATLDNLLDELEAAAHGYGAGEGAYANVLEAHRAILHYCCPEATDGK